MLFYLHAYIHVNTYKIVYWGPRESKDQCIQSTYLSWCELDENKEVLRWERRMTYYLILHAVCRVKRVYSRLLCRQTASPAIDIVSIQYIMHDYKYSTEPTKLIPSSFIHTNWLSRKYQYNNASRLKPNHHQSIPSSHLILHLRPNLYSQPTHIYPKPSLSSTSNPKSKLSCHVRLSHPVALDLLLLLLSTNRILMHHRLGKWTLLLMTRIMMNVHSS